MKPPGHLCMGHARMDCDERGSGRGPCVLPGEAFNPYYSAGVLNVVATVSQFRLPSLIPVDTQLSAVLDSRQQPTAVTMLRIMHSPMGLSALYQPQLYSQVPLKRRHRTW